MMKTKDLPEITVPAAAAFVQECFGFDYYNLTARMQSMLRRPLMILVFTKYFGYLENQWSVYHNLNAIRKPI